MSPSEDRLIGVVLDDLFLETDKGITTFAV